ncbi:hypothetical protein J5N97_013807 [Dioscorea zingiberensis]|uniref:FACT complex subunit SSRP1 n=1 Tax=Dioscorea zingiberensis TaxID=325984 RepID=A0A9D5HJ67_9LILI|nr:hypothetical protein J5N97_013807 [Dioscorea zingiberensis]
MRPSTEKYSHKRLLLSKEEEGILMKEALDVTRLTSFIQSYYHITFEEEQISLSGHNWGDVEFKGKTLSFSLDSKNTFEVCLIDVAQTQLHGKTDVHLEFHSSDTTRANENNSLLDLSFHIPDSNTQFNAYDDRTPAQVFHDKISCMIEVESSEGPVVTFEQVQLLTPRYAIELYISFLHLQGFANAFKIQYSNIHQIFVLPKFNEPHTCVAISLNPPLQRGQTQYPYIVLQFETKMVVDKKLTVSEELWADKYKDPLEASYKIEYVAFQRDDGGSAMLHYFDLLVKHGYDQQHEFRNIRRTEYHKVHNFMRMKSLWLGSMAMVVAVRAKR